MKQRKVTPYCSEDGGQCRQKVNDPEGDVGGDLGDVFYGQSKGD